MEKFRNFDELLENDAEKWREAVRFLTIGEPLKSAFHPDIRVDGSAIRIEIQARDRDPPHAPKFWRSMHVLQPAGDMANRLRVLRGLLIKVITHEVDESLMVGDERIFDPHGSFANSQYARRRAGPT